MKSHNKFVLYLFALLIIAGCASTKVTSRKELVTEQLPKPAQPRQITSAGWIRLSSLRIGR